MLVFRREGVIMLTKEHNSEVIELRDQALTTQEACHFLNISRQTLYKLVKAGKFPGRKVGDKYRFFKSEILEYFRYDQ